MKTERFFLSFFTPRFSKSILLSHHTALMTKLHEIKISAPTVLEHNMLVATVTTAITRSNIWIRLLLTVKVINMPTFPISLSFLLSAPFPACKMGLGHGKDRHEQTTERTSRRDLCPRYGGSLVLPPI